MTTTSPESTVAILGAGHGGCAAAADLASRGFNVRLHARNPERLAPLRAIGGINVLGTRAGLFPISLLTTDLAEAIDGAGTVMIVTPGTAHAAYARGLAPLLSPDQLLAINPGHTGGGLHVQHELRAAGYKGPMQIVETVTLTYISRMVSADTVHIYADLHNKAAVIPGRRAAELFSRFQPLYPKVSLASGTMEAALSNMNAVFHPPGMLMNAGWIEHTGGDFLFYHEGMTEAVGRTCAAVDAERMAIARAFGVPCESFMDFFFALGATTAEAYASGSISRACRESEPNRAIKAPPSLRHRYVEEDIGHGLVPMAALGDLAGVPTPVMDGLIALASTANDIDYTQAGLTLRKMGLDGRSLADIPAWLERGD